MAHRAWIAGLLAFAALLSPPGWGAPAHRQPAQPPASAPDPDAILRAARSAILTARSFSFRASVEPYGIYAALHPTYEADVVIERLVYGSPVAARFAIRGERRAPGRASAVPIEFVYDGTTMRWRNAEGKVASAPPGAAHADLLAREEMRLAPEDLVLDEPLTRVIDSATLKLAPPRTVEGVACSAVEAVYARRGAAAGEPKVRAILLIGVDDRIPRRIEYPAAVEADEGEPSREAGFTVTLGQLRLNEPPDPSAWRIAGEAAPPPPPPRPPPPPAPAPRSRLLSTGDAAPDWSLRDAAGTEARLSDFRGEAVVLEFWSSGCAGSLAADPRVRALHEKFKDRGVRVVAVSIHEKGDPVADPTAAMKERGDGFLGLVRGEAVAAGYGVRTTPTFYVIGADGKVVYVRPGFTPGEFDRMERIVERAAGPKR